MLFNSIQFLIFFPVVTFLYFALPHRFRWLHLLLASCVFYMVFVPAYVLILFAVIVIDYVAGIAIESAFGARRKLFLAMSLAGNLGILMFFKYFNFLNSNASHLASLLRFDYPIRNLDLLLPIGLSFHTFQSMSYTLEVYRGNQKAERRLGIFAVYVMFYPQLVAGPIERPGHLLRQFRETHYFDPQRVASGLILILWGMFRKVVIADRLAEMVGNVYLHPRDYPGLPLIAATVAFAFQIYYDFSAYSDIAIGSAKVMGFQLVENFRQPYLSKSVGEFWRRWHISLSTWFRDYLYIPMGGSRLSAWRNARNLMVTFMISGLWHGANWTFVTWGALNGFYLLFSRWTEPLRNQWAYLCGLERFPLIQKTSRVLITFSFTCVGWVFFRAASIQDAVYILTHLFANLPGMLNGLSNPKILNSEIFIMHSPYECAFLLLAIPVVEIVQYPARVEGISTLVFQKPAWVRWTACVLLVLLVMDAGKMKQIPFIYFQF